MCLFHSRLLIASHGFEKCNVIFAKFACTVLDICILHSHDHYTASFSPNIFGISTNQLKLHSKHFDVINMSYAVLSWAYVGTGNKMMYAKIISEFIMFSTQSLIPIHTWALWNAIKRHIHSTGVP